MKTKEKFRIKRSTKIDGLLNQNPMLKQTLQKILGGRPNSARSAYGRLAGIYQEEQPY